MDDRHTMRVCIDDGSLYLIVKCPYDLADTDRPCWPYDTERDEPEKLPAPQGCNYTEWCDNLAADELLHGQWEVETAIEWDWGADYPVVYLGAALPDNTEGR